MVQHIEDFASIGDIGACAYSKIFQDILPRCLRYRFMMKIGWSHSAVKKDIIIFVLFFLQNDINIERKQSYKNETNIISSL